MIYFRHQNNLIVIRACHWVTEQAAPNLVMAVVIQVNVPFRVTVPHYM